MSNDQTIDIKTVDPTATQEITVKDLKITIRTPGLSDRLALAGSRPLPGQMPDPAQWRTRVRSVANLIIRIDGWEDYEPIQVLEGIQTLSDFVAIEKAITGLAFASEETEKN